jgi:hypothetical protein
MLGLPACVFTQTKQIGVAPENLFSAAQQYAMIPPAGNAQACTGDRCGYAAIVASPYGVGR